MGWKILLIMAPTIVLYAYYAANHLFHRCKKCRIMMTRREYKMYNGVCKDCQKLEAIRLEHEFLIHKREVAADLKRALANDSLAIRDVVETCVDNRHVEITVKELADLLSEKVETLSVEDFAKLEEVWDELNFYNSGYKTLASSGKYSSYCDYNKDMEKHFEKVAADEKNRSYEELMGLQYDMQGNNLNTPEGRRAHREFMKEQQNKKDEKRKKQKESYEDMMKDIRDSMR